LLTDGRNQSEAPANQSIVLFEILEIELRLQILRLDDNELYRFGLIALLHENSDFEQIGPKKD
jgi:hypothetical protein